MKKQSLPYIFLQLMLVKGTVYEDIFRLSDDPIMKQIFNERMLPYMDEPDYPTVSFE